MFSTVVTNRLKAYFSIIRPLNAFFAGFAVLIGMIAALNSWHDFTGTEFLFYAIVGYLTTVFLSAGGYVINDFYDIEIDRVNKPHRPLPSGNITEKEALLYAYALFFFGFLIASLTLDPLVMFLAAFGIIMLILYAKYFKKTGLIGHILVALLTAIPFLYGGIIAKQYFEMLFPASFAFLLILGRELVKDIEDAPGDRIKNVKSVALTWGVKSAQILATLILGFLIVIDSVPIIIGIYNSIIFTITVIVVNFLIIISLAYLFMGKSEEKVIKNAETAKRILKIAIVIGIIGYLLLPIQI